MSLDRNYTTFFKETFRKSVILQLRYPLNTVMRFIVMYIFFLVLFFGGQAIGGPNIGDTLDGLVVGFFLWGLTTTAYRSVATNINAEAQWGTLEQLMMAVQPFKYVMVIKAAASILESLLYSCVLLVIMMVTTGRWLTIDLLTVGPIVLLAITSAVGVGLVLGGFALVYKQVGSFIEIAQFAFIALISAPAAGIEWARVLPISQGAAMLQEAMREGTHITAFALADVLWLIGVGMVYFLVGLWILSLMIARGRKLGVIGDY
jgi:ABC-2 type transport system permease protein